MFTAILTKTLPSQGRDPHDNRTIELPGIEVLQPIPDCMVTRIAAVLYGEGEDIIDDEVPWLVLFLREESEWEAAEQGDFRAKARIAAKEAA